MGLDPRAEDQIRLLADPDNRVVLRAVRAADRPVRVDELAKRLVNEDVTVARTAAYDNAIEDALIALHHDRLPRLAEAGLIEYDRDANAVTYRALDVLEGDPLDGTTLDELVGHLRPGDGAEGDGVEVIEGREPIIRTGRRLADEAEEELFCMYVTTDLLEDGCVRRAENALDRGVTMYLGSQNSDVRNLVRELLPGATVWEPQLDWMNAPTYPRLGRLVLADRRAVMLAVLREPDDDGGCPEETAVVGEGEGHPLVVLVRELLGSRLDHLDYQSDAFRAELPR